MASSSSSAASSSSSPTLPVDNTTFSPSQSSSSLPASESLPWSAQLSRREPPPPQSSPLLTIPPPFAAKEELGPASNGITWKENVLIIFMIMVCFMVVFQCFAGSEVLRWRSFYGTQDAWKSHYREVFDHGIREALCCLGRARYMTVLEEDEVNSVAHLLGDLVAYRATGTGHLEFLAGLALLQRHSESPKSFEGQNDAPKEYIEEAVALHQYAEAAYTGPLLDVGRNLILFPCAWFYRQGLLTAWTRNRRPLLEGDNWWRGHAAAFLNYVKSSPEALRQGRVCQAKCQAAYFVLVSHQLRTVVIAVRGTETPEDLITDGLCGECTLTVEDLDGNDHIHADVRQTVMSSFPHYGHLGIIGAARDLYMQVEGNFRCNDDLRGSSGLLSSLLGAGCECDGYNLRIVGHSLGGAIAALLGIRLYGRFPNLHVYAFGPLPCVDSVVADACSGFITSVVYDHEFSSRLSIASLLRLRAAAITSLSDVSTDSTLIARLARRFLFVSKYEQAEFEENISGSNNRSKVMAVNDEDECLYGSQHLRIPNGCKERGQDITFCDAAKIKQGYQEIDCNPFDESAANENSSNLQDVFSTPCHGGGASAHVNESNSEENFFNPFCDNAAALVLNDDPVSKFMEVVPSSEKWSPGDPPDVFLPGLVIHIVPKGRSSNLLTWKSWKNQDCVPRYKAYIANRESFKDIAVSPDMFLDHLPWRCYSAMKKVLKDLNAQDLQNNMQMGVKQLAYNPKL
ncbi:Fungal lipase-like domain [Dillenia turbinata]|uniref:Fungal lipase-like domain n=1 Tax=Dillenia turbinata TaxID=194707 RepID=A0AAN8ZD80_9MAGN